MRPLFAAALFALTAGAAPAQQGVTVTTLLADDWDVEGIIASSAGPGILFEKDDRLVMCFVAETPTSATIVTQYCKPVE